MISPTSANVQEPEWSEEPSSIDIPQKSVLVAPQIMDQLQTVLVKKGRTHILTHNFKPYSFFDNLRRKPEPLDEKEFGVCSKRLVDSEC